MKKHHYFLYSAILTALITAGLAVKSRPAHAQAADDPPSRVMEEIVVVASPYVRRRVETTDSTGRTTETLTLKRHISYADLDLSKYADVSELRKRIEVNAKEACEELDELYPIPRWDKTDMQDCINRAISSANDGLEAAIANAE